MSDPILDQLERLIRTDPARRGLIASEPQFGPLLLGHLQRAAVELAEHAASVCIVTGFYIPGASPPAAETDGPLGAVLLAETLRQSGVETSILTDNKCLSSLQIASTQIGYPASFVHSAQRLQNTKSSHLIALERVGPNHTAESIRQFHPHQPDVWRQFEAQVPEAERDHCYNMRGECIDKWTTPLHELFEEGANFTPRMKSIGIGDGGNEIGMGSIPWTELTRRLPEPHGRTIACRVPCDFTIIAGVSNWGGYALAAAVAHLKGRVDILEPWTSARQFDWLQALVRDGPAVDGVSRLPEPTVDGLPFATYIQPWDGMRQLLGLNR